MPKPLRCAIPLNVFLESEACSPLRCLCGVTRVSLVYSINYARILVGDDDYFDDCHLFLGLSLALNVL